MCLIEKCDDAKDWTSNRVQRREIQMRTDLACPAAEHRMAGRAMVSLTMLSMLVKTRVLRTGNRQHKQ